VLLLVLVIDRRLRTKGTITITSRSTSTITKETEMLIYNLMAGVLCLLLVGFVLVAIPHILNVVFVIIAAVKAGEGQMYRYPLTIRLLN
jgi:uncharacterized Tic20 family protein